MGFEFTVSGGKAIPREWDHLAGDQCPLVFHLGLPIFNRKICGVHQQGRGHSWHKWLHVNNGGVIGHGDNDVETDKLRMGEES
jgi:hypothetical protein